MSKSNSDFIISNNQLSRSEINEVLLLDTIVYPKEYCSDFDQVISRFNKNKDCFITVRKQNDIIAYICFFPITNKLASMIINNDYTNDSEILPSDVLSYEEAEGVLYIISIVVKPEYQSGDAIKLLMSAFEIKIQSLACSHNIKSVLATAISLKGHSTLLKSNFIDLSINEDEKIFVMEKSINMEDVCKNHI